MIFREFVEETKDAVAMLAGGVSGGRDITPMVHLETEVGRELVAVDPQFFEVDGGTEQLVGRFIVPMIQERMAMKVAWTFTSALRAKPQFDPPPEAEPARMVTAVVIDGERTEAWLAPLFDGRVGEWLLLPPNNIHGLLVGPVQEALR